MAVLITTALAMSSWLLLQPRASGEYPWNREIVEPGGGPTSVVVDGDGGVHAAYLRPAGPSYELAYGLWKGVAWTTRRVDAESTSPSLAVNVTRAPRIGYFKASDSTVRYAWFAGSTFLNETVERPNGTGVTGLSLALDVWGQPHMAYWNYHGPPGVSYLQYASRNGTGWAVETLATGNPNAPPGPAVSLAMDSKGSPWIAAVDVTDLTGLVLFTRNESAWYRRQVDPCSNICRVPSLRLDSQDIPHIAYDITRLTMALRYARYDALFERWLFTDVYTQASSNGGSSASLSLAIDRNDRPRISYFDTDAARLHYFLFSPPTGWLDEAPDTLTGVGEQNSLALNPLGAPHITYWDYTNSVVKHAWRVWPDTVPPSSRVDPILPHWKRSVPVTVTATATDPGTGVANVTLWSRFSGDNVSWSPWTPVSTLRAPPWAWSFNAPNGEGYYEFHTTSWDLAGNEEPPPPSADARMGHDGTPPVSRALLIAPYWYASPDLVVDASATDAVSGVAGVGLLYSFAPDNATWSPWAVYGARTDSPWSWPFPFPDGEGNYRFHTIARDVAGNVEADKTAAEAIAGYRVPSDYAPANPSPAGPLTVGLSLPVTFSLDVENLGGTANATATLAFFNASTPGVPFATFPIPPVYPGATAGPFSAPWMSPAAPGTYAVVADVDHGDALAESDEMNNAHTWTVDVVPGPITDLVVGQPNVTVRATYVTSATPLSLSVLDQSGTGIRGTRYRVDGGAWVGYLAPFTLAGEGPHVIEYSSEDNAGNVEPTESATLRVDDTPPTTTLAIGDPKHAAADTFVTSSTPLSLAASDGGASPVGVAATEYRVDGGPWIPYGAPFSLPREGAHLVEYGSSDLLGNGEPPGAATVIVDDSPPSVGIDVGTPRCEGADTYVTSATRFTLAAADRGVVPVGIASLEYRLGGAWTPYASPFTLSESDGPTTVAYRSSDFLGHVAAGQLAVVLDDTPPVTTPSRGDGAYPVGTTFGFSAADAGSGLARTEVRVDGGSWTTYSSPLALAEGPHAIEFRSVDNLDNAETPRTLSVSISAGPQLAANWKPLVAAAFASALALAGGWSSRRAPWPTGSRRRLRAFAVAALPFVLAEAGTGVVSLLTGLLAIPPLLGAGTAVDLGILLTGVAVSLGRVRKRTPPR